MATVTTRHEPLSISTTKSRRSMVGQNRASISGYAKSIWIFKKTTKGEGNHGVLFPSTERNETEQAYFKLAQLTRGRSDFRAPRSNDSATDGSDGEKVRGQFSQDPRARDASNVYYALEIAWPLTRSRNLHDFRLHIVCSILSNFCGSIAWRWLRILVSWMISKKRNWK